MRIILIVILLNVLVCCTTSVSIEKNDQASLPETAEPTVVLNVGFLVVDGVYNSELIAPMDIFHHTIFHTELGMRVFTIAPDSLPITTFEGLRLIPDYSFYDSIPPIDVLVVPSAKHSMDSDLENSRLIEFVEKTGANAKYIMSLCDGAFVLAKAGLVDEKESTTFPSDIEKYKSVYPQLKVHSGVSFVHDDKLITSVGGAKSYESALYLAELLYGNDVAKGLAKGLVIDWDLTQIKFVVVN